MSTLFANDAEVIRASADYLKAYAIDCLLTCSLFCFIGFFNGMELHKVCHAAGHSRSVFDTNPRGVSHEQANAGLPVPCGFGHSELNFTADHDVFCLLCCLAKKAV